MVSRGLLEEVEEEDDGHEIATCPRATPVKGLLSEEYCC